MDMSSDHMELSSMRLAQFKIKLEGKRLILSLLVAMQIHTIYIVFIKFHQE